MIVLLGLHLAAAICAPLLVKWWRRNAFFLLAIPPASAAIWALAHTQQAFNNPITVEYQWVPSLDLTIAFRIDVLAWLMMLIVGGVGALVMIYAARYFSPRAKGLGRFGGVFVGFAGAMLGVVTVDQTMALYLFWELTSVLSFLLIGQHHDRRPARAAARQAVLVTSFGALAMFSGLVILGEMPGGSYRISELIAAVSSGTLDPGAGLTIIAAILVLLGALTKSAQVPFHFWLPGAMAAPTPVSAYLHAAAMVKAGVYLIARLTPGFTLIPGWSALAVIFGLSTMILGAYRALRQYDLKLILAYGTVSQLGLMTAAVGMGNAVAMSAGIVLLVAHSLFKSALFLTVGTVESTTGTRDLRELSGLWKRRPLLAAAAGVAALSMAGIPITTGYLGKEALLVGLIHGVSGPWMPDSLPVALNTVILVVVVCGSMLTFAYAWRMWWGAFAVKRIEVTMRVKYLSPIAVAPIVVLASGATLGLAASALERVATPITAGLAGKPHLALWSGWEPAVLTLVIFVGGTLLAYFRPRVARIQRRLALKISVVRGYSWLLRELEIIASRVTAVIQRGSLPYDLNVIFISLVGLVGYALLSTERPLVIPRLWDSPLQAGIVLLAIIAAFITARARRRMKAVLALAAVGMSVTLLYATQGAPDLALTQLVVEAVSIVVFVLVLRKLPLYFSDRPLASSHWWRMLIAIACGTVVIIGGWYAASGRIHDSVSTLMPAEALNFGNGLNIVNVILVDIRAWDTVGELSVLLVTATGVASLIYVQSRSGRIDRAPKKMRSQEQFLPAAATMEPRDRSLVLEVSTRLLFPTMLMLSVWLLLVGHNAPGGGFAGGVVAGLAFVLRYVAGGRYELGEAMPIPAGRLLGFGLFVAAAGGAAPLLFGNAVLESTPVDIGLGPLGDLHFTTAMILDVGVYLLVIGLVIDLVSALGAEIDRQTEKRHARQRQAGEKKRAGKSGALNAGGRG